MTDLETEFIYFVPLNNCRMSGKNILLGLILLVVVCSCKKEQVPIQDDYYFSFDVKISNKITEPTIINGYYGHVLEYNGNFMPSTDGETKKPDTVRNELYLYESSYLEQIQEAKVQKDGTDFYDLKKLEKNDIKPKFIVRPNKSGFYQIDTNQNEYLLLIEARKNLGYYNGGPLKVGGNSNQLRLMNMKIDYNATF